MNWKQAFLHQARSDFAVSRRMNDPAIEYSHRLHYLQMVTEKLAKSTLCGPSGTRQPPLSHGVFVRMLQTLKGQPDTRRILGFDDVGVFRAYINSLLDAASKLEKLAPALAGLSQPNPEYPWQDNVTGEIVAPALFEFSEFNPLSPAMGKLERLVQNLLQIL